MTRQNFYEIGLTFAMQSGVAIRQLLERGPLPVEVVNNVSSTEIVPDPSDSSKVMLRAERDLLARVADAEAQTRSVSWADIPVRERLLFRQQARRLNLKRLERCGSVYPFRRYGIRGRRELLTLINNTKGGVECFDIFLEYPDAHQDVLNLIREKKIANLATALIAHHASP